MIRLMFARPEVPPSLRVFEEPVVTVGRTDAEGASPDWPLDFPDVSRRQCRFVRSGGALFVEATSERSPTFVNNRRISASTRLAPGDQVRFGHCTIRFIGLDDAASDGDATRAGAPGAARGARDAGEARSPQGGGGDGRGARVRGDGRDAPGERGGSRGAPDAQGDARGSSRGGQGARGGSRASREATDARASRERDAPDAGGASLDEVRGGASGEEDGVDDDASPVRAQAQRWEQRGRPPELLLRGDALRDARRWARGGRAVGADGALVRRFVEASLGRRRRALVRGLQVLGLAAGAVGGGSATASYLYPALDVPPRVEVPPGVECDDATRTRAGQVVARAEREEDGVAALVGLGHALDLAAAGGCEWSSGAEAALRRRLAGHRARILGAVDGAVRAVALRADGRWAAVADSEGALSFWDLGRQAPGLRPVDGGHVGVMAWSGDQRWLATGGTDAAVLLWDVKFLPRVEAPRELVHGAAVTALAFSADGATLASADRHAKLRLWDIGGDAGDAPLAAEVQLAASPSALVFDAAGARLFGLVGGRVWIWSVARAGTSQRLAGGRALDSDLHVTAMAVDRAGQRVVTGDTAGQVLLWTLAGGRWQVRPLAGHADQVLQVQLVPARDAVVSAAADRSLKLTPLPGKGRARPFPQALASAQEAALHLVVDAAGRRMLTAGASGAPELWDLGGDRGEPLARLDEQRVPVTAAALAEPQAVAVTGGSDGSLRAWDLAADGGSAGAHVLGDLGGVVDAFALGRAGTTLASADRQGQVRVWSLDEGVPTQSAMPAARRSVHTLALASDGRWLAGAAGNLVYLWDLDAGDARQSVLPAGDEEVGHLGFAGAGEWLVAADRRGAVMAWRVDADGAAATPTTSELGAEVTALALADGRVAAGTRDAADRGRVYAWSLTERGGAQAAVGSHPRGVTALSLDPAGSLLVSGGAGGDIAVRTRRDGRFVDEPGFALGQEVSALASLQGADGRAVVAVGGDGGRVAVRGLAANGEVRHFEAHVGPVRAVGFAGAPERLLTAGQDGELKLWRLQRDDSEPTAIPLSGHTGAIRGLQVDASGQVAVSLGVDQTLRVWPLTTPGLLRRTCMVAGRGLHDDERTRVLGALTRPPLCDPQR